MNRVFVIILLLIGMMSCQDPVNVRIIDWQDADTVYIPTDTLYIPKDTIIETIWIWDTVYVTDIVYRDTCDEDDITIRYDTLYWKDYTGNLFEDRKESWQSVIRGEILAGKRIVSDSDELNHQLDILYGVQMVLPYKQLTMDINRINWPIEARGLCWTNNYDEYLYYFTTYFETIWLKIPPGKYEGNYMNPSTGMPVRAVDFEIYEPLYHGWIQPEVNPPYFEEDIVLYLRKVET